MRHLYELNQKKILKCTIGLDQQRKSYLFFVAYQYGYFGMCLSLFRMQKPTNRDQDYIAEDDHNDSDTLVMVLDLVIPETGQLTFYSVSVFMVFRSLPAQVDVMKMKQ